MTIIYDFLFVFLTFNMSKIKINPYFGRFYAKKTSLTPPPWMSWTALQNVLTFLTFALLI